MVSLRNSSRCSFHLSGNGCTNRASSNPSALPSRTASTNVGRQQRQPQHPAHVRAVHTLGGSKLTDEPELAALESASPPVRLCKRTDQSVVSLSLRLNPAHPPGWCCDFLRGRNVGEIGRLDRGPDCQQAAVSIDSTTATIAAMHNGHGRFDAVGCVVPRGRSERRRQWPPARASKARRRQKGHRRSPIS